MKDDSKKRDNKTGTHSDESASVTRRDAATTAGSAPPTDNVESGDTMEPPQPLDSDATSPVSENEPPPASISTTRVVPSPEPEPQPTAPPKTTTRAPITQTKAATGALPQKTDLGADSTAPQEAPAPPAATPTPAFVKEQHTPPGYGGADPGLVSGRTVGSGRFTLIRLLGRGGMGIVWLAKDGRLREEVALKLLPPEVAADPTSISDLGVETQKSRRLTHPHIIRIHDLYEAENEPVFISMEFVNGPNLTSLRLKQEQRFFGWEFIKPLMIQLCEALDYAHDEKVIHRDLKPANLMLDSKGRLKLADFGIAATLSDSMSRVSRKDTSGTLVYMSPQQMDGETPRPTDDIYALGCTMYELLTSKPPFYTGNIEYQVHNVVPKLVTERLAEFEVGNPIPDSIVDLIVACLMKDPKQRPQSAGIVLEWIKNGAPPEFENLAAEPAEPAVPPTADIPPASGPGTSRPRTGTARTSAARGTPQPEPTPAPGTRRPTTRTATGPGSGTTQPGTRRSAPPSPPPDDDEPFQGETAEAPAAKPSPASRFLIPVIAVAVIVIAGLVFMLLHSNSKQQQPTPTQVAQNPNPTPTSQATTPTPQPTKQTSTPPPEQKQVEQAPVVAETPPPAPTPAPEPAKHSFFSPTPNYPTADAPFENGLGLKFIPVPGTKVLFSTFDTRVEDYQQFVTATKRDWPAPSFAQDPTHPAVNILWSDAEAFCKWLTEKEQAKKIIGPTQRYRLPTDVEWSIAAGMTPETGSTPADRDSKMTGVYPWGKVPVPDSGVANLGRALRVDDFDRTSPVGSFPPNPAGLYDMGGNVRQWCEDTYDSGGGAHVLRGSSWASVWNESLLSSVRTEGSDNPCEFNGFRCILELAPP